MAFQPRDNRVISMSDNFPEFHRVQSSITTHHLRYDNRGACGIFLCALVGLSTLPGCFSLCCPPDKDVMCQTVCTNQSGGMSITHHLWNLNVGEFVCPTPQMAPGLPSSAANCGDRDARQRIPQMWTTCHECRAT